MVICSRQVEEALIDIYFDEFRRNTNTPIYYRIKSKLFELDKPYLNRKPGRYPAWQDMFEIQIGCCIFGYSWDGQTVCIEECYKEKIKESIYNTMENKKVIRLTESDLHRIISESIQNVLNEIGDTYRGQYMLGRVAGGQKASQDDMFVDTWDKARKERAKSDSRMDRYDSERAFNRGLQNQVYYDKATDAKRKYDGMKDIKRDFREYQSFDN